MSLHFELEYDYGAHFTNKKTDFVSKRPFEKLGKIWIVIKIILIVLMIELLY